VGFLFAVAQTFSFTLLVNCTTKEFLLKQLTFRWLHSGNLDVLSTGFTENHPFERYKQYHMKGLLNSFYLNGHTLGFHPQTQKLEPPCTA